MHAFTATYSGIIRNSKKDCPAVTTASLYAALKRLFAQSHFHHVTFVTRHVWRSVRRQMYTPCMLSPVFGILLLVNGITRSWTLALGYFSDSRSEVVCLVVLTRRAFIRHMDMAYTSIFGCCFLKDTQVYGIWVAMYRCV